MEYQQVEHLPNTLRFCLLQKSNIYNKVIDSINNLANSEKIIVNFKLIQKNNCFYISEIKSLDAGNSEFVIYLNQNQINKLYGNKSINYNWFDTILLSINLSQISKTSIKRVNYNEQIILNGVYLEQKDKGKTLVPNIIHLLPKVYLCVLSQNNLFKNLTPNKYITDSSGPRGPYDCTYNGYNVPELTQYHYYIDLNNKFYDLDIEFDLDFDDAVMDMTEATVNISY